MKNMYRGTIATSLLLVAMLAVGTAAHAASGKAFSDVTVEDIMKMPESRVIAYNNWLAKKETQRHQAGKEPSFDLGLKKAATEHRYAELNPRFMEALKD